MKQIYCIFILTLFISTLQAQFIFDWSDPIDVAPSSFGNDYPRVVLDGNNMPLVTWGGSNKVYFSKMTSSGFTEALKLNNDTTNAYVANWTGPDIASRNDTIYACFMHQNWGKKTYLISSFDNGSTFSDPMLIENYPDSTSRFPTVAIDRKGNPIVAIMKMTSAGHHPQYVVRRSFDYGQSFTEESAVGGWSGPDTEACDCCPASIKVKDEKVSVFYRDNLNNIRDIYASVSSDYGATFPQGFAVDDNQWQIFGCPSTGPDGIIIGDTLYTVFFSKDYCYLSKSSVSDGSLVSISIVGDSPESDTQNFPRIDNFNNEVAISWRANSQGTKIFLAYFKDITNGTPFIQDTIYASSCSSADIAIGENGLHVVVEAIGDGTVKYLSGTLTTTPILTIQPKDIIIYPNPSSDYIIVEGYNQFDTFTIFGIEGKLNLSGKAVERINITSLLSGSYYIELSNKGQSIKKLFVKN